MKYPYIGRSSASANVVLFYDKNKGVTLEAETWARKHLKQSNGINEVMFENITSKFLTSKYGKIDSQEHADFIIKLAEVAGFKVERLYPSDKWFCFGAKCLWFYQNEYAAGDCKEKKIYLPLPEKENDMNDKEWPQVGDEVLISGLEKDSRTYPFEGYKVKVLAATKNNHNLVITFNHPLHGLGALNFGDWCKKPMTTEEELATKISGLRGESKATIGDSILAKAIIDGEIEGLSYKPE